MESSNRSTGVLLALCSLCSIAGAEAQYDASCSVAPVPVAVISDTTAWAGAGVTPKSFQSSSFPAVFGEGRCSGGTPPGVCANGASPDRFHFGIDIQGGSGALYCVKSHAVYAIRGGVVSVGNFPGCQAGDCIRIVDSPGRHAFDYIHVVPLVVNKQSVNAGDPIGYIDSRNHLHLDDVDLSHGIKVNPEVGAELGSLDFSDADSPNLPDIPTAILDSNGNSVVDDIIPVTFPGDVANANGGVPTALPHIATNEYAVPRGSSFGFLVTADGSQYSDTRKGIYSMTVTVAPASNPSALIFNYNQAIGFDSLLDSDPSAGIENVYYKYWSIDQTYFGTNSGTPCNTSLRYFSRCAGLQSYYSTIDPSKLTGDPNGNYNVTVIAESLMSPGLARAVIDRKVLILHRAPTIQLSQYGTSGFNNLAGDPSRAQWFSGSQTPCLTPMGCLLPLALRTRRRVSS